MGFFRRFFGGDEPEGTSGGDGDAVDAMLREFVESPNGSAKAQRLRSALIAMGPDILPQIGAVQATTGDAATRHALAEIINTIHGNASTTAAPPSKAATPAATPPETTPAPAPKVTTAPPAPATPSAPPKPQPSGPMQPVKIPTVFRDNSSAEPSTSPPHIETKVKQLLTGYTFSIGNKSLAMLDRFGTSEEIAAGDRAAKANNAIKSDIVKLGPQAVPALTDVEANPIRSSEKNLAKTLIEDIRKAHRPDVGQRGEITLPREDTITVLNALGLDDSGKRGRNINSRAAKAKVEADLPRYFPVMIAARAEIERFDDRQKLETYIEAQSTDAVGPILLGLLEAESGKMRRLAISEIGTREMRDMIPQLVDIVKNDPSDAIRASAIGALGRIGADPADVYDVIAAHVTSEDSLLRSSTLVAIGKLGDPRALNVLLDHLDDEVLDSHHARYGVYFALVGFTDDPRAQEAVTDGMKNVKNHSGIIRGLLANARPNTWALDKARSLYHDEPKHIQDAVKRALKFYPAVESLVTSPS
ncbi:MAG: HEAT repeat domain-containing protein [Chloroflexota bacterium]